MINLSDTHSWPVEVRDLLWSTSEQTYCEKQVELTAHEDGSHHKSSPTCPVYNKTKALVEHTIQDFEIRAFHCTRLIDPTSVYQTGLEVLSPPATKLRVMEVLRQSNIPSILLAQAGRAFDDCEKSSDCRHRKGRIWFVLTEAQLDHLSCADLFRYFGGEMARHALDAIADEVFPILASIGVPTVVEARLPIRDAQPHHLSALADEFISLGWREFSHKAVDVRGADLMIKRPITAGRILAVWEKT